LEKTSPFFLIVRERRIFSSSWSSAGAGSGVFAAIPFSSTNTVVTIKKIRRMNTMSINGEMLISVISSLSPKCFLFLIVENMLFVVLESASTSCLAFLEIGECSTLERLNN
jgi:hypothetical protein